MAHQDVIPIPIKGMPPKDMMDNVFFALTRDNPLIYFLNQSAFSYASDDDGNIAIVPQYFFDLKTVKEYNRKIEKTVNGLAYSLKLTEGTEYERELKIHDWLCQNVEYDKDGHDLNNVTKFIVSHNIIGVFAHHKAQCEGIAKAAKVLLNAVDIRCIVATGIAKGKHETGPHAWNIVNIDNKPYQVDITWDIGCNEGQPTNALPGSRIYYDYFNLTDSMIMKTRSFEKNLPECVSEEKNYFTVNKVIFKSKVQAIKYVEKMLSKGQMEFYFRLDNRVGLKSTYEAVNELICKFCVDNEMTNRVVNKQINEELKILWFKVE